MGDCEKSLGQVGKVIDELSSNQPTTSSDGKELVEHLWNVHGYIITHFRFGDSKAALVILFNAMLLKAFHGAGIHQLMMNTAIKELSLLLWAAWFAVVLLAIGIVLAMWSVLPKLRNEEDKGFIYWESIASHEREEAHWRALNAESELPQCLANHLFAIAVIAKRKFRVLQLAMWSSFSGMIVAGFALWFC